MARRCLVVAQAVGPDSEIVDGTLARFGFAPLEDVPDIADALDRLRKGHYDLVVVPIAQLEPVELASLEREIRKERYTFVIGTGPRADSDLVLRAMRSGIHEFLTAPVDAKEFAGAVDRLMRRGQGEVQRGQVFAVYSAKGGLGSTTVAVNLADAIAKNHPAARVAIGDLVVAGGDVRIFLNLSPAYDMGDLALKLDRVDADLLNSLLTPADGGVWALPGPDNPEADDLLDTAAVSSIIEHLRSHFGFTVLDCEHHLSERTLAAMDAADRIILLTQLTVPALRGTQRTLSLCRRLGYSDDRVCVVVNRHHGNEVLTLNDAAEVLKHEIDWKLPNDYKLLGEALTQGVSVSRVDPNAKLSLSFQQLATKIGGGALVKRNGALAKGNGKDSRLGRLFSLKKRK